MRARNPLYIMAKPPPEVQAQVVALPRNDPGRSPDLLHVTLATLFDLHQKPPEWLPAVIAALDSFDGPAFPLLFDRIENRKAVTLRNRAPLTDGTTPEPHVTINYHGDRLRAEKMPPIAWTVDEILLVESVVGKTTHIVHGRWPLHMATP